MTIKMKLSGLLLGILLATTSVFAGGSCGAGKCGAEMKKEMKETCTSEKMKEMKGSCGAGKCGTDMKTDSKNDMKDTSTTK